MPPGESPVVQGNRNGVLYLGNGTEPQTIDPPWSWERAPNPPLDDRRVHLALNLTRRTSDSATLTWQNPES